MTTLGRPGNTRDTILAILRRREGASVDDIARELDLSGATVRRHLDVLLRDGLVEVEQVRGRTGRPRHAYSLTEAGAERLGHHYVRITHRLVDEIAALSGDETANRQGEDLAALIFERMAARLVREYAPRIGADSIGGRLNEAVALLAEEGLDFELVPEEGGWLLLGRGCPCHRLNGAGLSGCAHDRQLLEELVHAPTRVVAPRELPNEFVCGYRVEDRPLAVAEPR